MENVYIENPVVIKEVEIDKTKLQEFKKAENQIRVTHEELQAQIEATERELSEAQDKLSALQDDKEALQKLIVDGNAGLTSKLLETERGIRNAQQNINYAEDDLINITALKGEQVQKLESILYNDYMESGVLVKEFNSNMENMQLQYYSLLYKAFEVAQNMIDLEHEYINSVEYSFKNVHPYKTFIDTFNHRGFVNAVRNNFTQYNTHKNITTPSKVEEFLNKVMATKDNPKITLYK